MRKHIFILSSLTLLLLASCTKMTNPTYTSGTAPTLTSSVTSVAATPSDSLKTAIIFGWTDPKYPAPFPGPAAFAIQIDTAGGGFKAPIILNATPGVLGDTLTAKQLNDIVLGMGGVFNKAYSIDVRVISSYSNNNAPLNSNTLTIQVTPYKTPPKVTPPPSGRLYIVGSAMVGGWANPVDTAYQEFTQKDSVTYVGTFYLIGGGSYDMLPVNGDWSNKYNVAAYGDFSKGGAFEYVTGGGSDIPAPATSGVYTITVNFQTGTFTVAATQVYGLLWVPGDYQSWAPASAPNLASINQDGKYEGYINLTTTGGFKLAGEADWNGTNYGDTAAAGMSGVLSTTGGNMNIASTGYYLIQADTKALTWSATKITQWGLIGDFNSWGADVVMTYNTVNNNWTGTIVAAAAGGFKVRANGAWTLSLGTGGPAGSLTSVSGGNIPITAGTHNITMSLAIAGYYTITVQ